MKRFLLICLCLMISCSFTASAAEMTSYTLSLFAGESIRSGPGAEYELAQILSEDGVFTIIEEALGSDYEYWGKLKSGAGWVQLTHRVGELPRTLSLPAGTIVYSGPDHTFAHAQTIDENGVFTIVDEIWDDSENPWGKLKSGAGWVALNTSSYIMPLDSGTDIYEGPGYGFIIAKTLDEKGVFTIVEEAWDEEGNLWGRLKSGAGWVFLQSEWTLSVAPLRAFYAEDVQLQSEPTRVITDTSEYAVDIVLIPNEDIRNIVFSSLQLTDIDYEVAEILYSADEMKAYDPLLVSVAFPGDMSAYGFTFTDGGNNLRRYTISISGRDGSLELMEVH